MSMPERMKNQIEDAFHPHVMTDEQSARARAIAAKLEEAAVLIAETTLPNRQQSLCMTSLEQAKMWATSAIAVEGPVAK